MEFWGVIMLIAAALVIGGAAEFMDRGVIALGATATAVGAFIGGYLASEQLGSWSDWGTEWFGVRIFPALIGAVVVGAIVEVVYHLMSQPPTSGVGHPPLAR